MKGCAAMPVTTAVKELQARALKLLPADETDLILAGIMAKSVERMREIQKTVIQLRQRHGSLEQLESTIREKGVAVENHSCYNDLLEWRAIQQEMQEIASLLGAV